MNTTLRQIIVKILKDSQSIKNIIAHFENESFFEEYRANEPNTAYRIPIDIWENLTDISRECVDLLPPSLDGSIYFDKSSDFVFIHKE